MSTILIVEDMGWALDNYKMILSHHTLLIARNEEDARSLFEKHKNEIDLIILDGQLDPKDEGINTFNLAADLRSLGYSKEMLAASSDLKMNRTLQERGCTGVIWDKKSIKDIVETVNKALGQQ